MYNEYEAIYEELCERVECGELTLEDAELINDAAYERYVTEFKADIQRSYDDRLTRDKLSHNHHPYEREELRYNSLYGRRLGRFHNKNTKKSDDDLIRNSYYHGKGTVPKWGGKKKGRTKMKLRGANGKKKKEKNYLKNITLILMINMLVFNKK